MRVYTIGWVAMPVIVLTLIWLAYEPVTERSFPVERNGKTSWKFYQPGESYEHESFRQNGPDGIDD